MLNSATCQGVQHLVGRHIPAPGEAHEFLQIGDVEITNAPISDLARAKQRLEPSQRFLQRYGAPPMQQIEVDAVGLEAFQTTLARRDGSARGGVLREDLGHQEDLFSSTVYGLSHED